MQHNRAKVPTANLMPTDLNKYEIPTDGGYDVQDDNSVTGANGVSVYFKDLEKHLISHILEADAVFGAVAWLTHPDILDAMASIQNTSIIIQKEDFLRPDIDCNNNFRAFLIKKYAQLKNSLYRFDHHNLLSHMSCCSQSDIEPIRCVGNHNREKSPAFPRMHNKFLVFAKVSLEKDNHGYQCTKINPYAVWTGSFNFTKNATFSLENALYITQKEVVDAYYREYGQIAAISEPLNWKSDWMAPEWRIGT